MAISHVPFDPILLRHTAEVLAYLFSRSKELGPIGVVGKGVLKTMGRYICCGQGN